MSLDTKAMSKLLFYDIVHKYATNVALLSTHAKVVLFTCRV